MGDIDWVLVLLAAMVGGVIIYMFRDAKATQDGLHSWDRPPRPADAAAAWRNENPADFADISTLEPDAAEKAFDIRLAGEAPLVEVYTHGLWLRELATFMPFERLMGVYIDRHQPPHGKAQRAVAFHFLLTDKDALLPHKPHKPHLHGLFFDKDALNMVLPGDDDAFGVPHEDIVARVLDLAKAHNGGRGFRTPRSTIYRHPVT